MRTIQSFAAKLSVLEAAVARIAFIFDHFEHVVVIVSGGTLTYGRPRATA